MNNDIVQLTDKSGNNIYPIAGGATQDSISKSMLAEGVFEGPELFPSPNEAYVRTENIVDGAVTSDKIDSATNGLIAYRPGDTITSLNYESYQGFGRGANSKTRAILFMTLSKPIIGVSSVTISWGQYALQFFDIESGTKVFADPGTATATQFTANGFQFQVDFPTAFTTGGNYEYGFFSLGSPTITFNA